MIRRAGSGIRRGTCWLAKAVTSPRFPSHRSSADSREVEVRCFLAGAARAFLPAALTGMPCS